VNISTCNIFNAKILVNRNSTLSISNINKFILSN
jgi:hypothetical protein